MPEVPLEKIAPQWRARVKEFAGLVGVSRKEVHSRMKPGDPDEVTWAHEGGHRVIDVSRSPGIPVDAIKRWQRQRPDALQAAHSQPAPAPKPSANGQLSLELPQSDGLRALSAFKSRLYRGNPTRYAAIEERFLHIEPLTNHKWNLEARTRTEYVKNHARRIGPHGVSAATVWRWYRDFNSALAEGGMDAALDALGNNEPGPERGFSSPFDDSMKTIVTRLWLEGKTRKQCYEGMMAELHEKARKMQAGWVYNVPQGPGRPLYYAVMRFINAPPRHGLGGIKNPARKGREAVFNAAGYIDRHYDDEPAGYTWCIDEWELDGFFYLRSHHRTIVNPYMVSVIDERTTKILGWRLSQSLDAEIVLDLMEELVREYGPPRFLVSDRLGHYRRMLENKKVLARKSDLVDRLAAPLGLLGVTNRGPKREKNPRGNRIERMHGIYSVKARRDFGPSWREPLEGKHKARRVDENVKRHLHEHCRLGTAPPQLLSFEDAEQIVAEWVAEINAADTEANGCNGLSRQAAFLQFQPATPRLRPSQATVDLAFAQKIERIVRAGGVIEIDGDARYSSPQLLARTGEKAIVVRYRRDKSSVFVHLKESREAIEAALRVRVGTKDTAHRLEETAKLQEARAFLAQQEVPLAAFEDTPEKEAEQVRDRLPRSLADRHPGIEQAARRQPPGESPLTYFGDE